MSRSKRVALIIACLFCAAETCCRDALADDADLLDVADLRIRDPFVVTDVANGRYVMVASMSNRQRGGKGWECYTSKDLRHWRAPVTVFTPPAGFWADRDFWAPEIHAYRGKFYLFGTVSAEHAKRGTQVFAADGPLGPFQAHTDRAATPHDWMALDGTLHVENNQPWMVFCHEWVQISDGTMNAVRLADDLAKPVGEPIQLFRASDAPWCRPDPAGEVRHGWAVLLSPEDWSVAHALVQFWRPGVCGWSGPVSQRNRPGAVDTGSCSRFTKEAATA